MVREPIGLYIFRYILGFGLFAFMAMLYWSSLLLEKDMQILRSDMSQLKNELHAQREDFKRAKIDSKKQRSESAPSQSNASASSSSSTPITARAADGAQRPHIDSSLPNLLSEDVFYQKTLPEILGEDFKPQGTFRVATLGRPNNLHPFSNWVDISRWRDLCLGNVGRLHTGIFERYAPDLAIKVEERKNPKTGVVEYWVHLRDDVYWQPLEQRFFPSDLHLAPWFLKKHRVTACDFKFFYDAMMNPYNGEKGAVALQTYYRDIEEIEVIDDWTFVVRWKPHEVKDENGKSVPRLKYSSRMLTYGLTPLPCFVYQYFADGTKILEEDSDPNTYRNNSVWAQNFSNHWAKNIIVSCGAWIFDGMSERQIAFRRNPEFPLPFRPLMERYENLFLDTPDGMWQAFKAGQLTVQDLPYEKLLELETFLQSPEHLKQAEEGNAVNRLDYTYNAYAYMGWNEARPFFASKKVRQAMTMAIDRERIINKNLNGMAIETTGTFSRYSNAYDPSITPWPFDLQRARQLLEEEGWVDLDGDGIREKVINGQRVPFRFTINYFVKSNNARAILDYISTTMRSIGVDCRPNGLDMADMSAAIDDKDFDAIFMMWALGVPPEDPRQLWYSSGAKVKGSSNTIGFVNKEADEIIDKLDYEYDSEKRTKLYHRFNAILHDEAPYTFMFVPRMIMLYRDPLQNVFIPADRQDLIPGANVSEPISDIFWLRQ